MGGEISDFIEVGKLLAKLPAMILPQYRSCAGDMYEISRRILKANENLCRWLYLFLYFDFRHADARSRYLDAVRDYKTMKVSPDVQALRWHCHDIEGIYRLNIESKIGGWFTNQQKLEEVQGVFGRLTTADAKIVDLVHDNILTSLDTHLEKVEQAVDAGRLEEAERLRLEFESLLGPQMKDLEEWNTGLAELAVEFARIAGIPVTL